jgi:hypothetical protein
MIGTSHLEKLLKVIGWTLCPIALSGGNRLLIRVIVLLIMVALIAAGSDCDSLGSSLWPSFVALGALLCALTGYLDWRPLTATWLSWVDHG